MATGYKKNTFSANGDEVNEKCLSSSSKVVDSEFFGSLAFGNHGCKEESITAKVSFLQDDNRLIKGEKDVSEECLHVKNRSNSMGGTKGDEQVYTRDTKNDDKTLRTCSINDICKEKQNENLHYCDPCLQGKVLKDATKFCKTCKEPEPLCENCAQLHTFQKATRGHEIEQLLSKNNITSNEKLKKKSQEQLLCEPCKFGKLQNEATMFCKTCDDLDPLCKECAKLHTRQKATRGHEICDDMELLLSLFYEMSNTKETNEMQRKPLCDPCKYGNINTEATMFCKTCDDPDPLCKECAKLHTRQKATRGHEICADIAQIYSLRYRKDLKEHNKRLQERILCDSCKYDNVQTEATVFCKTCKEPDPLCDDCGQLHTRQRATRGHELCDDKEQLFFLTNVPPENKRNKRLREKLLCDSCKYDNIQTEATVFCKTCKEPDPLCEDCGQLHTRQRATRGHELCNDKEQLFFLTNSPPEKKQTKQLFCDPCKYGKLKTEATMFCKTCDDPDPLCKECAKLHTRQKATRGHEICDDIKLFLSLFHKSSDKKKYNQSQNLNQCSSCECRNTQTKAKYFCKTCENQEPMCKQCARQHILKNETGDHEICDDFRELSIRQKTLPEKYSTGGIAIADEADEKVPGKPYAKEIKSDFVRLIWEPPHMKVKHFQVRYKITNCDSEWKFAGSEHYVESNYAVIKGLMADTDYIFQVRGVFGDQEGPYGPLSDKIKTQRSSATMFLGFSEIQQNSTPSKYLLPVQENKLATNKIARTRQLNLGSSPDDFCEEKTIMLVGSTGSGKSTLVDGIVNYILGVSFEDPFRFSLVTLEREEKKNNNQAHSQTEWITVYRIYPTEGSRLDYTLNIIDTPGFGDTRGIERDYKIVDQIRHLFSTQGDHGVLYIDAVCFIAKAPDARLTVVQKYIFSSIMSLFGKDIESNICTLITFADGAIPPVLASLKEAKLPFGQTFTFNNSALYAENKNITENILSPMFWEMGRSSFERFFDYIKHLETKSLSQTKSVLDEREQLKTIISGIRPQISAGLSKLSELKEQLDIFQKYKNEIKDNENFEYTVDEVKSKIIPLPKGQHVTNCLICNVTCHENCKIAENDKKKLCSAMNDKGYCTVCTGNCRWNQHQNTMCIITYFTEPVTKTYYEMKNRFEKAYGHTLTHEKCIEQLTKDIENLFDYITSMMNDMNRCKSRLKEIALRPDPLSATEHIDLMIHSETTEKQPGYLKRVQMLEEIKKMALIDQDVEMLDKNIKDTQKSAKATVGKPTEKKKGRVRNFFSLPW